MNLVSPNIQNPQISGQGPSQRAITGIGNVFEKHFDVNDVENHEDEMSTSIQG